MYQRATGGGGGSGYEYLSNSVVETSTHELTISGLTVEKKYYMIVCFPWTNTNYSIQISANSGVSDFQTVVSDRYKNGSYNVYLSYGVYTFTATATSATFTNSNGPANVATKYLIILFEQ